MSRRTDCTLREFATREELFRAAADFVVQNAQQAIAERGHWQVALAGGGTPRDLYAALRERRIDAARSHIWWGDERCVAPDDPDSNSRMAMESWLAHWRPRSIHRIQAERGSEPAARDYAALLAAAPPLDLALLGLGADGHTASLFPGRSESLDEQSWAVAARAPEAPIERVSMGLRPLRAARERLFLVVGTAKLPALRRVLAGDDALAASRLATGATFLVSPPLGDA